MRRSLALMLAVVAVSCADSGGASTAEPVRLRVAALHGLGSFAPSKSRSGASSYALSLTHVPFNEFATAIERDRAILRLRIREGSRYPAQELARLVSDENLESSVAVDDRDIVLTFRDPESAALYEVFGVLAVGPYELGERDSRSVTLRSRRSDGAISVIEIVEVDPSEAWRRLLARDIDAIPNNPSAHRPMFDDVDSVRVVIHEEAGWLGLLFNQERVPVGERQLIAAALDRQAIAQVGAGTETAALAVVRPTALAQAAEAPAVDRELTLIVLAGDKPASDAARVVRLQLADAGIAVAVSPVSLEELIARSAAGDFDLAIAPLQAGGTFYANLAARDQRDIAHYDSPRFEELVEAGDLAAAEAILSEDVPVLPLFERRSFAAIDARFCGGAPVTTSDWSWLADLYPCEEAP